jgi:hypothetical protein
MLDRIILIVFGAMSTLAILFGILSVMMAVRAARKKDAEIAMVFWAFGALAGFTAGGMMWAYFLIPVLKVLL